MHGERLVRSTPSCGLRSLPGRDRCRMHPLPRRNAPMVTSRPSDDNGLLGQPGSDSSGQGIKYAQDIAALHTRRRPLSQRMAHTQKLLIADDDPSLRLLVSATLASASYELLEANTGSEALRIVQTAHPRLAL